MEGIGYAKKKPEEVKENIPAKRNKKMRLLVLLIILAAIFIAGRDAIFSEYNKLLPKGNANNNKSVEKTEAPSKESNFIKDVYLNKIDRAKDITRKANLRDIKYALELYFTNNGGYPVSGSAIKLNDANSSVYKDLIKYTSPDNLKDPKDPKFFYLYKSDGKTFEITARLENDKDPDCEPSDSGYCIYRTIGTSAN